MSEIFNELINNIGNEAIALSNKDSNAIFELFEEAIPLYPHGSRIDWSKINDKIAIDSPNQIITILKTLLNKTPDLSIYILWDDASLPVVKTNLSTAIAQFENVVSISFEAWLFNPDEGYLVECHPSNQIFIGLLK